MKAGKDLTSSGYVWPPYVTKNVKTDINGETVWYANKWENLFLTIKHFFVKPKYLKNAHKYKNKMVNSSYYREVTISNV